MLPVYHYIQLSRCCSARGSSTEFSRFSPTKVEACKSFLFTEGSPVLYAIKNVKNAYFDQHFGCSAPKCWSKYSNIQGHIQQMPLNGLWPLKDMTISGKTLCSTPSCTTPRQPTIFNPVPHQ